MAGFEGSTTILAFSTFFLTSLVYAGNSDPSQASTICAEPGSDSTLIAHEDCEKFYKCFHGSPVAKSCPGNLLYNADKKYCDWPDFVKCGASNDNVPVESGDSNGKDSGVTNEEIIDVSKEDETSNNSVKENKEEADNICSQQGSDGKLIAHEDCHKFYECSDGKAIALSCPDDLRYSPEKEYCDWPRNVQC